MSTVVTNIGAMAFTVNGTEDTKSVGARGDQGTVRVIYENREYVFGPNNSMTLEDGIAAALVAQDARLRIMDQRDGFQGGQAIR